MAVIGGMGIGLVWGWLAASVDVLQVPQFGDILGLSLALASLSILELALGGGPAVAAFLAAAALSFLVRSGWRAALRKRFEQPMGGR